METYDIEKISRHILSLAPDAILYADAEGLIRIWNRGAEMMFGYSADEALGQSLDLIIPERLRARHWEGYRQVMASGKSRYGTKLLSVPALHRSGQQLSCEFSIVMLKNEGGEVVGVGSIMRDITARWAREKELKERIADLESATAK